MPLKTDLFGNPIGSVIDVAGHTGCITYDKDRNRVYSSLEIKHDFVGNLTNELRGEDSCSEDNFYLLCFDCESITKMDMDAEKDGIVKAVHLCDVVKDFVEDDEVSGKKHRYGCSGIDGTGYGPIFGADKNSLKKIMVAYGIYCEPIRKDNDYQVILQYDPSIFEVYGKPITPTTPRKSGPARYEEGYFLYTGNTDWGVQNLE